MLMKNTILALFLLIPLGSFASSKTDIERAKKQMIQQSIASYSGSCPCPYNTARNGSNCGRRSAYSKPGGASPLCYPQDISDQEAMDFLRRK